MRLLCSALLLIGLMLLPAALADDAKLEPGFTALFNGKDLTGWQTKNKKESLDGKAEAFGGRFKVAEGIITLDPKVKGDVIIETVKQFGNATIRFEFKPEADCNNDLFFRGTKFDIKKGDVKNWKIGEWNQFEIAAAGDKAAFTCNGEAIKTLPTKGDKSAFGIRAELGAIQIRNIRVKEAN